MSTIEWLVNEAGTKGETWNALEGCTPCSPGCLHCYAAGVASRGMSPEHRGLTKHVQRRNAHGKLVKLPVFNGRVVEVRHRLLDPLRWKKRRRVFVNSMSDLFHEEVSFEFIAAHHGVMALCQSLTFLTLTKRMHRALDFAKWLADQGDDPLAVCLATLERFFPFLRERTLLQDRVEGTHLPAWPLPNLQFGFSAEDQPRWDERREHVLEYPAAVHWVSIEPLLGRVDIGSDHGLDWVVVGGESGAGARPCHTEWIQEIVDRCVADGTRVFVKQLGDNPWRANKKLELATPKGGDPKEWVGALARLRRRELAVETPRPVVESKPEPQLTLFEP